jgi:ATP-dependent metalloprotease
MPLISQASRRPGSLPATTATTSPLLCQGWRSLPSRPRLPSRTHAPRRPGGRQVVRVARPSGGCAGSGDPGAKDTETNVPLSSPSMDPTTSSAAEAPWPGAAQPAAVLGTAILGKDEEEPTGPSLAGIVGWAAATAAAVRSAGATATAPLRAAAARLTNRRLAALRAAAVAEPANPATFATYADALIRAGRADEVVTAVEADAWPPVSTAAPAVPSLPPPPPSRRAPLNQAGAAAYLRALGRMGALDMDADASRRPPLPDLLADLAARSDANGLGGAPTPGTLGRPGASAARPLHITLSDGKGSLFSPGARPVPASGRTAVGAALSSAWLALTLASFLYLGLSASRRFGDGAGARGSPSSALPASGMPALPSGAGMATGSPLDKLMASPKAVNDDGAKPDVRFSDVRGCDEAKAELEEIVDFLKDPARYTRLGAKLPKGLLMTGPPGTGKTLLARAVAGEAGVPFFARSGAAFDEVFVGLGSGRIRKLFEAAKAKAPCIVFIDEIDALGASRRSYENSSSKQTLDQLLVELDGFDGNSGVIVIGATNLGDALDPALTRAGRFDRHVSVSLPDVAGRADILQYYLDKTKAAAPGVDARALARRTPGFSGADLATLVNEAALKAAGAGAASISPAALDEARDKVMMGAARPSLRLSPKEREKTAFHEAGHALVSLLSAGASPIHKATIVPRGGALGMVAYTPDEDSLYSMTKRQMVASIDVALAGRATEALIFGQDEVTSGASDDLRKATSLARAMVSEWGFSDVIGPRAVGDNNPYAGARGGGGPSRGAMPSAALAEEVDREVGELLKAAAARVDALLTQHTTALRRIAAALLEHETLTGEELRALADGKALDRVGSGGAGGGGGSGSGRERRPGAVAAPVGVTAADAAAEAAAATTAPRRRWSLWRRAADGSGELREETVPPGGGGRR